VRNLRQKHSHPYQSVSDIFRALAAPRVESVRSVAAGWRIHSLDPLAVDPHHPAADGPSRHILALDPKPDIAAGYDQAPV